MVVSKGNIQMKLQKNVTTYGNHRMSRNTSHLDSEGPISKRVDRVIKISEIPSN